MRHRADIPPQPIFREEVFIAPIVEISVEAAADVRDFNLGFNNCLDSTLLPLTCFCPVEHH